MTTPPITLGSSSPRRQELLAYLGLNFSIASPPFDEDSFPMNEDPEAYVLDLARLKNESLNTQTGLVLCCDTIVYHQKKILEKPKDRAEARQMLGSLQNSWHEVYTALNLSLKENGNTLNSETTLAKTRVKFTSLNEKQIENYIDFAHSFDKAGGYAIQGKGALAIEEVSGCFYNVMGLPVHLCAELFKKFGVDVWEL